MCFFIQNIVLCYYGVSLQFTELVQIYYLIHSLQARTISL